MSEWKCQNCGAGVSRFDILCRRCNDENSAALDADQRVRGLAQELLALLIDAQEELRLCREKDGAGPYDPTLRSRIANVIAKARGVHQ